MAHRTTTFLLADDDGDFRFFVERAFAAGPPHLKLQVVDDGLEAKKYLAGLAQYADRNNFPLPQVILLDLKMPKVDGFEFLRWLHLDSPKEVRLIPTIVMAGSTRDVDVMKAYELGVNAYVVKPANLNDLQERIKALGLYWGDLVERPPNG